MFTTAISHRCLILFCSFLIIGLPGLKADAKVPGIVVGPNEYDDLNNKIGEEGIGYPFEGFRSAEENECSLVAFYPFNGNADDVSGNGNHGTVSGAVLATDRFGNPNTCYYFDGDNDRIEISNDPALDFIDSYTFSVWMKFEEGGLSSPRIFSRDGGGGTGYQFFTRFNGIERKIRITHGDGVDALQYESASSIFADNWYHLAASYENNQLRFYINGQLDTIISDVQDIVGNQGGLIIGERHANQQDDFKGWLDDIRIYNQALSGTDIQNLYSVGSRAVFVYQTVCDPAEIGRDTIEYTDFCESITQITVRSLENGVSGDGLIAYYPFNSNADDFSGNGNHGFVDGPSLVNGRSGEPQSAYQFDGTNDQIRIPNPFGSGLSDVSPFSVACWFQVNAAKPEANLLTYFTKCSGGSDDDLFAISLSGDSAISISNGHNSPAQVTVTPFADNAFHHLALSFDGTDYELYLDGVSVAGVNLAPAGDPISADHYLVLGYVHSNDCGDNSFFDGVMDEVSIYDRGISGAEVSALYNSTSIPPAMQAFYPFSGNVEDQSGNGHHGTLNGATLTTDRYGIADRAYDFNGTDDFIALPPVNGGNKWSEYAISVRIRPASIPQVDDRYFFYYNETSDGKCALYLDNSGRIYAAHHDGTGWREITSATILVPGEWYSLVINWDGQQQQLYVNGVLEDEQAVNFLEVADIGASIGRHDFWYANNLLNRGLFHGKIDDVSIYNRALSTAEIAAYSAYADSGCADCTTITDLPENDEVIDATTCLCELEYVLPQDRGEGNANGVAPSEPIYRADLAKLIYYALYKGDAPAPSDSFPVPFFDLQNDSNAYFRYARALSYLEYDDGVAPFDRDFANFRPYDPIQRRYALKVLLEAFDIAPDNGNGGTILGQEPGADAYGYVHKAFDMGLVNTGSATDDMLRGDMFVILHRLLSSCGVDCAAGCMSPNPQPTDYFVPGNFSTRNLGRNIGLSEGYFQDFTTTSFTIPGIQLPLNFTHLYNSYLTLIPDTMTYLQPLGAGWSHSYNAYIVKEMGWTDPSGENEKDHLIVFWPNGAVHNYDATTLLPETDGVYDEMSQPDPDMLIIKKLNQVRYIYERFLLPGGREIFMLYQISDRNNNTVTITNEQPSEMPRIDRVTGTAGRVLEFNYSGPGSRHISSIQDLSGGRSIHFSVDAANNLEYYVNPRGDTTFYHYDITQPPAFHLLEQITLPRGNMVNSSYDEQRKLQSVQYPGVDALVVTVVPEYYRAGGISSTVKDQSGTIIHHAFDHNGYRVSKSINDKKLTYQRGQPMDPSLPTQMEYEGFVSNYQYDEFTGLIEKIDLPLGVTHQFTYTGLNDIETYINPREDTTTYHYDANGNIDNVVDNLGFVTDFTVNNKGQIEQIENPENIIQTFSYDNDGNLRSILAPLGIETIFEYDAIGRMTRMTNPKGQVTEYDFDPLDLVIQQTRKSAAAGDIITRYSYDKNSNLDTITNALGGKTIYTYDDRDLLSSMIFGDDAKSYTYRDDGYLDTYTKPDNTVFQYQYDDFGRLETDGYAGYAYDDQDNITKITHNGQDLDMTYDSLNRITSASYDGYTVSYTEYNKNGNLETLIYPGGLPVTYTYDANNRLTSVQWTLETITYEYLDDGRLDRITYGNDTYTSYTYDAAGRMTGLANVKSNTTDTICAYRFTLDPLGNHLQEQRTEPFGDPTLAELNLNNQYNGENEIQASGATSFSFDANGNRTAKDGLSSTWDDRDMMLGIGTTSYTYDGQGLRRTLSENGSLSKKYIWDVRGMGNILAETDAAGTIQYYYIHGLGLCARVNAQSGEVHYYHYDFRGSTIAMTDAGQNITHKYSYLPFGSVVQEMEADPNPFKYVGRYGVMSEGEDLYYMRARYMDASTGRFLSEDPVWHENLYVYGGNNPVKHIDFSGYSKSNPIPGIAWNEIIGGLGTAMIEFWTNFAVKEFGLLIGSTVSQKSGAFIYAYGPKVILIASKALSAVGAIGLLYGGDAGYDPIEAFQKIPDSELEGFLSQYLEYTDKIDKYLKIFKETKSKNKRAALATAIKHYSKKRRESSDNFFDEYGFKVKKLFE